MITLLFYSCFLTPGGSTGEPTVEYPTLGLVGYFPFNGDLKDYSDSCNYCIDHTDSLYVDGIIGQAKDFNGETDMLRLRNTLRAGNGLTFSFWLKSRGVKIGQENGVVIGKYDFSTWGRCFLISTQASSTVNNPSLRGNFYPSGNTSNYADGIYSDIMTLDDVPAARNASLYSIHDPMDLPLNVWTHCVVNVSDTSMQAWINGTLTVSIEREYESYNDISQYYMNDVPTFIGNCPTAGSGGNNHYNGVIDELLIYNRPLTEEEILSIYEEAE